jgi:hypothetical protein
MSGPLSPSEYNYHFLTVGVFYEGAEYFWTGQGWHKDLSLARMLNFAEAQDLADRFDGHYVYLDRDKFRLFNIREQF